MGNALMVKLEHQHEQGLLSFDRVHDADDLAFSKRPRHSLSSLSQTGGRCKPLFQIFEHHTELLQWTVLGLGQSFRCKIAILGPLETLESRKKNILEAVNLHSQPVYIMRGIFDIPKISDNCDRHLDDGDDTRGNA